MSFISSVASVVVMCLFIWLCYYLVKAYFIKMKNKFKKELEDDDKRKKQ